MYYNVWFRFEGGLVERTFNLSEALAAVLEVFTLMKSTVDPWLVSL